MSEDSEARRRKLMEALSLPIEKFPRDLLQRFNMSSDTEISHRQSRESKAEEDDDNDGDDDSEEVELNLGLSLGGRFGVDKHANKRKLVRSSSIVGTMPLIRENESSATPPTASFATTLMRTSSLPTETEEEWRKRKELQTLRRMEAKRRRSEKQRSSKTTAEREDGEVAVAGGDRSSEGAFGLPAAARQVVLSDVLTRGKAHGPGSGLGLLGGSAGGCSESKPFQGSSSYGEARSSQDAGGSSGSKANDENKLKTSSIDGQIESSNPSKKQPQCSLNKGREIGSNSMEDMPCVFTQGDGPNGKRIEGILYRYGKGQEVRIMCVCHGNFLSPAEFVKHAGGGDVAHPLRHIVVNPSSSSSPYL